MQESKIKFNYKNCLEENIFLIEIPFGVDDKLLDRLSVSGKLKFTLGDSFGVFLIDSDRYFITGTRGQNEIKIRIKEKVKDDPEKVVQKLITSLK